jgi:hypothetical protein
VRSVQHAFHHVVIKIRQLFLRPAACLTSTLHETGVGANDCKCSRAQRLNVPSEAPKSYNQEWNSTTRKHIQKGNKKGSQKNEEEYQKQEWKIAESDFKINFACSYIHIHTTHALSPKG